MCERGARRRDGGIDLLRTRADEAAVRPRCCLHAVVVRIERDGGEDRMHEGAEALAARASRALQRDGFDRYVRAERLRGDGNGDGRRAIDLMVWTATFRSRHTSTTRSNAAA